MLVVIPLVLKSQIIPNATWLDSSLTNLPVSITNCVFAPYFTYAPAYKAHQEGGGFLFGYNFVSGSSGAVGGQVALDYLGHLSLATGDLTAQTPFHVDSLFTPLSKLSWTTNLLIVPEVRAGVTTAYSGGGHFNGTISGDVGVGAALQYKWIDVGYDYGKWIGNATFDVPRNHFFAAFRLAF